VSMRLAVFDCDGTLVDSQANILRAMEDCFARHRLDPPCRHATRRIVGLSLVEAMQALLPDADQALHQRLADDYKTVFQRLRAESALLDEPLYPGVAEGLRELDARGWQLGVATGKSDRGLGLCLAHHGIAGHFVTLQTADRHPSKPHPSMLYAAMAEAGAVPESTVIIGDTVFDMAMGVSAGVRAIGVDWGYHDADELRQAGASVVADRFDDLLTLLEAQSA
jgi:phosphoglycolate phosphatase